jgi:hypothetical protein
MMGPILHHTRVCQAVKQKVMRMSGRKENDWSSCTSPGTKDGCKTTWKKATQVRMPTTSTYQPRPEIP